MFVKINNSVPLADLLLGDGNHWPWYWYPMHGIPMEGISRWIYMAGCVQRFGQVKNIPTGEERMNSRSRPQGSTRAYCVVNRVSRVERIFRL